MAKYSNLTKFANKVITANELTDVPEHAVKMSIVKALNTHHIYMVEAVDRYLETLDEAELDRLSYGEESEVLVVCRAHMWSKTVYIILKRVLSTVVESIMFVD